MSTALKYAKYWVALSTFPKFGPKRFKLLIQYFPEMKSAFEANLNEFKQAGIDETTALEFIEYRQNINPDAEMERLAQENIKILIIDDPLYSKLLKETYDAPPLLYYKGNLNNQTNFCLAVVGSRKYTTYGQQTTQFLINKLAQAGLTIVSGLALGIDALAHNATLEVGGQTIAVLGSGVNNQSIYPASNRYLAEKIIANNGLIISEFPYGAPPLRHHFPQRNRIIAGLSLGTLIIEAVEKSGALITAKYALEQNRDIFAVPGNIFSPNSQGTNKLIQSGAKLVMTAEEILETLSLENISNFIANQKIIPESPIEKQILENLTREQTHINALARLTKLDTSTVNATLLTMELKGYVRHLGGGNYVIS